MTITRSHINSEFENIAVVDGTGAVTGVSVDSLAVSDVANVTIPGGTVGQVLTTDGAGNLSWTTSGGSTVFVATMGSETFTATAGQTVFTLARIPSGNVSISVNGVTLSVTAVTVAGTTVTYVPASNGGYILRAGDRVSITYLWGASSANALAGLGDVVVTSAANGDILRWDAADSVWKNVPDTSAFASVSNGTSMVDVEADGDITITSAGADVLVATPSGVSVSGGLNVSGISNLGAVGDLRISGGNAKQMITGGSSGAVAFANYGRLVTLCHATGDLVIPASFVPVVVNYSTKLFDPENLYDTSTARFQPKIAGWYEITASADAFVGTGSESGVIIRHNVEGLVCSSGSYGAVAIVATGIAYFNGTTDFINVEVRGQSGTTRVQNRSRSNFIAKLLSV
jgi:hypothetical protein